MNFRFVSVDLLLVSVQSKHRNSLFWYRSENRNKRFVSGSAETSFGSSFGCFKSKPVSKDTLLTADSTEQDEKPGVSPLLAYLSGVS